MLPYATEIAWAAGVIVLLALLWASNVVRYIPNNRVGIAERLWSFRGSVDKGFIALAGEAGFQPHVLRGGWHVFAPFQFKVHVVPLVTIPQGRIGYVFARDGETLPPTQTLASNATVPNRAASGTRVTWIAATPVRRRASSSPCPVTFSMTSPSTSMEKP